MGDLKYVNNNQWVDDDADDDGGDDHGGGDAHGGDDGDKMGKIRKSKFPKMTKKSLKIRKLIWNLIKWEKSQNRDFLKLSKSHSKSENWYEIT